MCFCGFQHNGNPVLNGSGKGLSKQKERKEGVRDYSITKKKGSCNPANDSPASLVPWESLLSSSSSSSSSSSPSLAHSQSLRAKNLYHRSRELVISNRGQQHFPASRRRCESDYITDCEGLMYYRYWGPRKACDNTESPESLLLSYNVILNNSNNHNS